eukprot:3022412-Pleurochrysis_carterae.AAC.1
MPPRARHEHSARHIHDAIAHWEEQARGEWFGKEVRKIVGAADKRDCYVEGLHFLTDEEKAPVDMLGALVVFWIVRKIDGGF